ncbi:FAD-dependent monooxygenase [Kineosporia sp. J2-2]|uniref:FAD-dependent monooxygenase n=1 Tax=Kineosporia corallincola TaxID=2835133 RepID=A0ABS5TD14_9ACTN|nr:FAD-dependent monooxygenase [Kineosporia corallincola]MBT0768743.1 FAD-dependent monooxygenase [Kineosporia corallincola]
MTSPRRKKVLISGASIAGPTLAHWLSRGGFEVTVVEKAAAVRGGGYPIDIRGSALGVVERMGLLPALREAHIDTRRITFLHPDGSPVVTLRPEKVAGGVHSRDLEVPRGDLTALLHGTVRDDVEFLFGESILELHEQVDAVTVTFRGGAVREFDLVVGADGLHSSTRGLVFGPEPQFHCYLGHCFAGFTLENTWGLDHEAVLWNTAGRGAALYAAGDTTTLHGFLMFSRPEPPFEAFRDPQAQRDLLTTTFADDGWEVPTLVRAMRDADDLFFDVVSQIRAPRWSRGRVALAGDAAHAPSFLTGQGTSLALAGAYLLARELVSTPDHALALSAYERRARPYVEANQALVGPGDVTMHPRTPEALTARNAMLRSLDSLPGDTDRPAYSALTLPDFPSGAGPLGRP